MLKIVAWLELAASVLLLAMAAWPFSNLCSGRFLGLDCESRAIFAVNMFGPLGILGLTCAAWSLKTGSSRPQPFLAVGVAAVLGWFMAHAL